MDGNVGLRERKKAETRRAIATAALDLAHERGPNNVTVEAIADAAGVSPRTVFNYFGTKDEAILGLDPLSRLETAERLAARPVDEPPLDSLRAVLVDRVTTVDETGRYWRSRAELVRRFPELRSAQFASQVALENELVAVIADRTGLDASDNIYPGLVVAAAFAALRVALVGPAAKADERPERLRHDLDAAFESLATSLLPPRTPTTPRASTRRSGNGRRAHATDPATRKQRTR